MSLHWDNPRIAKVLRRLASFSRLITFDQQGLGRSDPIDVANPPSLDDLVADLEAVMDAASVTNPVLFGTNNGGAVAIAYSLKHPVRHLIVCNTWARLEEADDFSIGIESSVLDEDLKRHETDWGRGEISSQYVSGPDDVSSARYELDTTGRSQAAILFQMNRTYDIRDRLAAVTAPTLVIHTRKNRRVPKAHGEYIAASIPRARLVLIPAADHFFLKNYGTEVVDEVEEFVTGRRTFFADQIRATVLFTDIVDSTLIAKAIGDDRWGLTIDAHNAVMERLVRSHRGETCKHTGDGSLFVFADPSDAVRCALAAADAVAPLGLEIRAGAHVGRVTRMNLKDLSGVEVHFANRVCNQAGPGQVLVSDRIPGECDGSGLTFQDRGRVPLKSFQGLWQLYEPRTRDPAIDDRLRPDNMG
jgi:class 3 adenylate cyclase